MSSDEKDPHESADPHAPVAAEPHVPAPAAPEEPASEPVAAEAQAPGTPAPEPVAPETRSETDALQTEAAETHGPAVEAEAAPEPAAVEAAAPAAPEPSVETVQAEPGPVAAAVADEPQARPIWSDHGDAPFDEDEAAPPPARGRSKKSRGKGSGGGAMAELFDILKTVVYALLIALVLRILFFQPFTIPSASMEPNLYEGDYIVVSKWSYGYSRHSIPFSPPLFEGRILARQPERGDIVVFKWPRDNRTDYIKRVIGLPGDRVQMRRGVLHINDTPVEGAVISRGQLENGMYPPGAQRVRETLPNGRSYVTQDFGRDYSDLDDTRVYVVPAGHYFMMGDNRDNSIDSRVDSGVGLVPEENLVGEAQVILFSWEPGVSLLNPVTWFTHARTSRFFIDLE